MTVIIETTAMPPSGETFLIVGYSGSGKTTLGLTLPKPALFIFFDPSGAGGVRGFKGVSYVEFLSDETGIMPVGGISSKRKDGAGTRAPSLPSEIKFSPKTYLNFIAWWNEMAKSRALLNFASIVLDSTSFLEAAIYDWVMTERGLWGNEPGTGEYMQFRDNVMMVARNVTAIRRHGVHVMFTTHIRDKTDQAGNVVGRVLKLYGSSREDLPGVFGNLFVAEFVRGRGVGDAVTGARYLLRTQPDSDLRLGKTSQKRFALPHEIDVTVTDWDRPEAGGLGKLIADIQNNALEVAKDE